MADGATLRSLKGQVSDAEWRTRVDLAALYGGALILEDSPLGGLRARLFLPAL